MGGFKGGGAASDVVTQWINRADFIAMRGSGRERCFTKVTSSFLIDGSRREVRRSLMARI